MEQPGKADPTAMGQPGTEGDTPAKKRRKTILPKNLDNFPLGL